MGMGDCAGDAVMGMIVTHLVIASTSSEDCETLHNRRRIMVDFLPQGFFALTAPLHVCMQNLSWATLHALDRRRMPADDILRVCLALQVMREFCAEVGLSSMPCHGADYGMILCFSCSWPTLRNQDIVLTLQRLGLTICDCCAGLQEGGVRSR